MRSMGAMSSTSSTRSVMCSSIPFLERRDFARCELRCLDLLDPRGRVYSDEVELELEVVLFESDRR